MSSQPHDALFKAVFSQAEHAAGLLSTLLPAAVCARLDWGTLAHCPGTFIDPQLAERRSDLLFRSGPEKGRRRCSTSSSSIRASRIPGWRAVPAGRPRSYRDGGVEQRPMTDLGRLALLFLQRVRISPDLAADVRRWLGMLGRVLRAPSGGEAIGLLLSYILSVLEVVPEGVLAALDDGLGTEAREVYMSAAQKLIDQGRVEGKAEMLLQLIQLRYGAPPPTIVARVRAASDAELAQWTERILTAPLWRTYSLASDTPRRCATAHASHEASFVDSRWRSHDLRG